MTAPRAAPASPEGDPIPQIWLDMQAAIAENNRIGEFLRKLKEHLHGLSSERTRLVQQVEAHRSPVVSESPAVADPEPPLERLNTLWNDLRGLFARHGFIPERREEYDRIITGLGLGLAEAGAQVSSLSSSLRLATEERDGLAKHIERRASGQDPLTVMLRGELSVLREAARALLASNAEMVDAMHRYEMDVDEPTTFDHREIMRRAAKAGEALRSLLPEQGSETQEKAPRKEG